EDMTRIRTEELRPLSPEEVVILGRRVSDPLEDRILEAEALDAHSEELADRGNHRAGVSLEDSLKSKEKLRDRIEGSPSFLQEVNRGYTSDAIFAKVVANPTAFKQFKVESGLVYARNVAGQYC
ncbi:hypothetical protein B0H14DRAFT_2294422, partial [Mycena olivaceomarginata]